jgi:hypothetical protein
MKFKTKAILSISICLLVSSCRFFKKEKDLKKEEQIKKEYIQDKNAEFVYNCKSIHYKTGVDYDTVQQILVKFQTAFEFCVFNSSNQIIKLDYENREIDKFKFIQNLKVLGYQERDIYLIFYEINLIDNIGNLDAQLSGIQDEISSLENN